jgi:DNA-binding NarL/FixJ family response regulator
MLTIYIVDDSAVVRKALATVLQTIKGVEIVGSAATASEALANIPALRPHAIVLDIHMRDGSGLDVLNALAQYASPPIILMLTAFSRPGLKEQCLEAGARYFFDKASEIDAFIATMQELASTRVESS